MALSVDLQVVNPFNGMLVAEVIASHNLYNGGLNVFIFSWSTATLVFPHIRRNRHCRGGRDKAHGAPMAFSAPRQLREAADVRLELLENTRYGFESVNSAFRICSQERKHGPTHIRPNVEDRSNVRRRDAV